MIKTSVFSGNLKQQKLFEYIFLLVSPVLMLSYLSSTRYIAWTRGGDEVRGSNGRCPLTSSFDAKKNSRSEAERAFDCHILAPRQAVIKLIVQEGDTDR